MSNELTIQNLLPAVSNREIVQDKLKNSTFIGIDFGTSTTVVSYAVLGDEVTPVKTDVIPIRQLNIDGTFIESHLVPSCIAWLDNNLFIGQTAKQYKNKLTYGKNLWYSFKMKLGEDVGASYYSTELLKGSFDFTIENPLDATKVFLFYLKKEIDHFLIEKKLPPVSYYSISIPASFEANQRKDLKEAIDYAGIPFQDSLFIDEPNAAFLSYLVESNANNYQGYNIPIDSPLHILVFDFGAGTCDISVLEIGRKQGKLYSKNIAISKYEQLGGDDIDRQIVEDVLYPQLLLQNNLTKEDIKSAEYEKIILPKLQTIAEWLKVKVCKEISSSMISKSLPSKAISEDRIEMKQSIPDFLLPQKKLVYSKPNISFIEFKNVIDKFITDDKARYNTESKSIFSVIRSAMEKANLNKDYIDLVLLVGGSSYNPYIQNALNKFFINSEVAIPQDLQALVSTGAGINSFLQNGLHVDMISPIISEPIFILLENETLRLVIKEGTDIPYKGLVIDNLHPQREGQKEIEIPICVSNKNKILSIIKMKSEKGFNLSDNIRIECDITHDKLIHFKAFIRDMEIQVEPLNPFANKALTTEEIVEKKLLKEVNNDAKKNGGTPSVELLLELVKFYKKAENFLKVAETYEIIQRLSPNKRHENNIYYYSKANRRKQAYDWLEIAYHKDRNSATIHNYALYQKDKGNTEEYERLMEEALSLASDRATAVVYGEYLYENGDKGRALQLLQGAYDYYYSLYKREDLDKDEYHWLISAAKYINKDVEAEVIQAERELKEKSAKWFNTENLVSDKKDDLTNLLPF